jgi:hypothetical protein
MRKDSPPSHQAPKAIAIKKLFALLSFRFRSASCLAAIEIFQAHREFLFETRHNLFILKYPGGKLTARPPARVQTPMRTV